MDRVPKVHDAGTDRPSLPDKNVPGEPAESVRRRQAAASYLRAARLTGTRRSAGPCAGRPRTLTSRGRWGSPTINEAGSVITVNAASANVAPDAA
jgi:hypothetical protein